MSAKRMIKRLNLKNGHVSRFITVGLESSIQISTYIYFHPNIITNDLTEPSSVILSLFGVVVFESGLIYANKITDRHDELCMSTVRLHPW